MECRVAGGVRRGTYITDRDGMAVVKLSSGYNIGLPPAACTRLSRSVPAPAAKRAPVTQDANLPELAIISTGGTIASRIDYRTGAVTSQFDADDILTAIPDLAKVARYRTKQLYTILSENMTPAIWQELARAVHEEILRGVAGVIVTHGTDTMAYSASALAFMLKTPVPVVFVGSQRSADRPSSDNAMNAACAAAAATSELGEVAVVMHETTSDDRCAIHRGTRVRKMHTSRRDAFASVGIPPIGHVEYPSRSVMLSPDAVRRGTNRPELHDRLEKHCGLVQFYPGMDEKVIRSFAGYKGLVLAGTGLGHTSTHLITAIRELVDGGTMITMTSQCLNGRVCDRVYDTGRDLLKAGVIEGGDMLPETALVKLMWVLANARNSEQAAAMMQENLAGECNRRSGHGL
ncbi:MAG: Glutamyl-tRNA(Gln) amidotransferase subunit D [Methanoregula sp. PtaU1.Bin051]|nr:MAG: Glutamyl-tRNA(Gln) amidotransferase subunit D [Methanoregula sp. PtaU1.Bin051]